jgi:hypothetical protein
MDPKESKNSTSKILQDRYARILGFDWTPPTSVAQTKKRKLLRWDAGILVLLILVLGIRYFINSQIDITKGVKLTKPELLQKQEIPSISELSPLPDYVASIANTIISEQNDSEKTALKTAVANDTVNHERRQHVEIQDKSLGSKTTVEDVEATQFFVIVMSTKSKDDAIEYAKKLGASGYSSEVILSSTNYYGVVLGRFSFEDAKRAMNAALVSGTVTNEPYLMTPDRVIDYVYPKSQ